MATWEENKEARDSGDLDWHASAMEYLVRLGDGEYKAGLSAHMKRGRAKTTFRFSPSAYMRELIRFLGENNEEMFKALKASNGYHSAIKV